MKRTFKRHSVTQTDINRVFPLHLDTPHPVTQSHCSFLLPRMHLETFIIWGLFTNVVEVGHKPLFYINCQFQTSTAGNTIENVYADANITIELQ